MKLKVVVTVELEEVNTLDEGLESTMMENLAMYLDRKNNDTYHDTKFKFHYDLFQKPLHIKE